MKSPNRHSPEAEAARLAELERIKAQNPDHYKKLFHIPVANTAPNPDISWVEPKDIDLNKPVALDAHGAVLDEHYVIPSEVINESKKFDRKVGSGGRLPPIDPPPPERNWWERGEGGRNGWIIFGVVAAVTLGAVAYGVIKDRENQKKQAEKQKASYAQKIMAEQQEAATPQQTTR